MLYYNEQKINVLPCIFIYQNHSLSKYQKFYRRNFPHKDRFSGLV